MSWIAGNRYLSRSEVENNAILFRDIMMTNGVTLNAVCGMLGNIQSESGVNPGIWESLSPFNGGYGLVQWTPYTKYSEWAGAGWEGNGDKQCERILYEAQNGLQWFGNPEAPIVNPPLSFTEFLSSTLDVGTLANYFLWYYEHPAVTIQTIRAKQANEWLEFFGGTPGPGPGPSPLKRKRMPVWMMIRRQDII